MTNNKLQLRASLVKEFVSDPLNYYKNIFKEDVKTSAMEKGIAREPISYQIYEEINGKTDYTKQAEGMIEEEDFVITCHCDILEHEAVIDIKNSTRSDEDLVKEYWYQLNAYAYCFKVNKAYLFVDTNDINETDKNKCRLVEVEVNHDKFINDVKQAVKFFQTLSYQDVGEAKTSTSKISTTINRLAEIQAQIKALEDEAKELNASLTKSMKNYYLYQTKDYVCSKIYKRDIHRKMEVVFEEWNGDYKESLSIKAIKK